MPTTDLYWKGTVRTVAARDDKLCLKIVIEKKYHFSYGEGERLTPSITPHILKASNKIRQVTTEFTKI